MIDKLKIDKNQQIIPSAELLNKLTTKFGSSFYLFNKKLFINNLLDFREAFIKEYPNVKIGYSFKTNYLPAACQLARKEDAIAEVVSGMEYQLALKTGYKGEDIIFNGPLKEKNELLMAFKNNSLIHFDSYEEIKILKDYLSSNPDHSVRCALRCNFDIGETNISRFGFDAENGEAEMVYEELFAIDGCQPIGIHCHFSTRHRSLESYEIRTRKLIKLAKKVFKNHPIEYIDIGGGFFGQMPKNLQKWFPFKIPSFEEYGKVIGQLMNQQFPNQNVTLILEPGTSIVANTMNFVCQVASIKKIQAKTVVTLTGGRHNVRPTGTKGNIPFRVIKKSEPHKVLKDALIGGYTCMETDIINESFEGDLSVGDYLLFDNMGAYNIVFKPPFIKEAPPILMFEEKNEDLLFKVVRKCETVENLFAAYLFQKF